MKLAIVGSRSFNDISLMEESIAKAFKVEDITEVISGGAGGADTLAEVWAERHNIPTKIFHAKWGEKGRAAGYARNAEMIKVADACIAFWDGSKGTASSISLCERYKVPCTVIKF